MLHSQSSAHRIFYSKGRNKRTQIMIGDHNFFDQPVINDIRASDNISRIDTVQGDDYTTCCLLDYGYFKENCQLIETI